MLLPAPFGPSSPVIPGETVNDIPLTATTLPYHRETSLEHDRRPSGGHVDTRTKRRSVRAKAAAIVASTATK